MAYTYKIGASAKEGTILPLPGHQMTFSPNMQPQGLAPLDIRGGTYGIDRQGAIAKAKDTLSTFFGEGFATDIMSGPTNSRQSLWASVPRATMGHQQAQYGKTLYVEHSRPMFKALAESHLNPLRIMFPVLFTNSTSFTFTSQDKILGMAVRLPEGGIAPATSSLTKIRQIELDRYGTRSEVDMNLMYDKDAMAYAIKENQENTTIIAVNNEARIAFNCLMSEGMQFQTAMTRHFASMQGWVQNTQLLVRTAQFRDNIGLILSWNRENGIQSLMSQITEATMNRVDNSQRVLLTTPNVFGNMHNHDKTKLFYMYRGPDGKPMTDLQVGREFHAIDNGYDSTVIVTMLPLPDLMRPLSEGALDYSTGFRGDTFISGYYEYTHDMYNKYRADDKPYYVCDFTDGTLKPLTLPKRIVTHEDKGVLQWRLLHVNEDGSLPTKIEGEGEDAKTVLTMEGEDIGPVDKIVPVFVRPQIEVATDSCVVGQSIDGGGIGFSIKSDYLTFVNPSNNNEKISTTYVWWAGAHIPHPERVVIMPDVHLVQYNGGGRVDSENAPIGIDAFLEQGGDNIHEYDHQGFWTFALKTNNPGNDDLGNPGSNSFPSSEVNLPFILYDGYLVWSQYAAENASSASSDVQEFQTEMSCPIAHMTVYETDKKEVLRNGRSMLNEYDYKDNLHVLRSPMTQTTARRIMTT